MPAIKKPEKILETATLYGHDERRIKNSDSTTKPKEMTSPLVVKQRSTTNTPDDREKVSSMPVSRGL